MNSVAYINPSAHSKPIGRYSAATAVPLGGASWLVLVSGQVATDEEGKIVCPNDAAGQAEVVFEKLRHVLASAGAEVSDLLSVTIYIQNRADLSAVSSVRNRIFARSAPSSTLVIAELAEEGCLVEISGIGLSQQPPV